MGYPYPHFCLCAFFGPYTCPWDDGGGGDWGPGGSEAEERIRNPKPRNLHLGFALFVKRSYSHPGLKLQTAEGPHPLIHKLHPKSLQLILYYLIYCIVINDILLCSILYYILRFRDAVWGSGFRAIRPEAAVRQGSHVSESGLFRSLGSLRRRGS